MLTLRKLLLLNCRMKNDKETFDIVKHKMANLIDLNFELPFIPDDVIKRQENIWKVYLANRTKTLDASEFEGWRNYFPKELIEFMDQKVNNNYSLTNLQDMQIIEDVVWNQGKASNLEFFYEENFKGMLETLLFMPFTMDFFYLKRLNKSIGNGFLVDLTNRCPTTVAATKDWEEFYLWMITASELLYYIYRSGDKDIDILFHLCFAQPESILNQMSVESDYEMFTNNFLYWHLKMRMTIKNIIGHYFTLSARKLITQKVNFLKNRLMLENPHNCACINTYTCDCMYD